MIARRAITTTPQGANQNFNPKSRNRFWDEIKTTAEKKNAQKILFIKTWNFLCIFFLRLLRASENNKNIAAEVY